MIMDAHTHIWTGTDKKKYFPVRQNWHICMDWAYSRGGTTPPYTRDPKALLPRQEMRMSDPEGKYTIANMDQGGIDSSVVFTIDYDFVWGEESGLSVEEKHQIYSELQRRYPGRLACTAGPEPRRLNALELYKRAIEEHKLTGIKLVPASGYYAWDPMLYPIYEYSLDNNQPVWFCTEVSRGSYRYTRFQEPVHISDMTHDFPDLTVVLAHIGANYVYWFEQCLNAAASNPNVYLQDGGPGWVLSFGIQRNNLTGGGVWHNAFNNEPLIMALFSRAKAAAGAHRIMWGGGNDGSGPSLAKEQDLASGYGWRNLVNWWRTLPERASKYGYSWTKEEVDMILGANAAHVMGVKRDPQREIPNKFGWRVLSPPPKTH
jgi:predicted TIM-barrel fold metal-dependent hydrolase